MWIPLPLNGSSGDFTAGPVVKTLPSNAGSSPGQGAKITHASWPKHQNVKLNQQSNKFNRDFKNGLQKKKKSKLSLTSISHLKISANLA